MYIKVRVLAGAKKEIFESAAENRFRISVKQKAVQNLANRRVIELVAAHYRVSINTVHIVSGHHSPSKIISIN